MLVWPIALAASCVFFVFRSAGIDYRVVAAGALFPLALSLPWLRPSLGHALIVPVLLLTGIMLGTSRRRLVRRRWIGLPIGMLLGQVALGAFAKTSVFMWPTQGFSFSEGELLPAWPILLGLETVGALLLVAVGTAANLQEPAARTKLLSSGRLDDRTRNDGAPHLRDPRRRGQS